MNAAPAHPPARFWRPLLDLALAEDIGSGDVTTPLVIGTDDRGRAIVEAREPLVTCGMEIARQCWRRGLRLRVETNSSGATGWDRVNRGDYDLLLTRTWGLPYDPHTSMLARLLPQPERPTAVETVPYLTAPELTRLVEASYATQPGTAARRRAYAAIQDFLDRTAAVVPLFICRRLAVLGPRVHGFDFGPHGYGLDLSQLRLSEPPDG